MRIHIKDTLTNKLIDAQILPATKSDMPLKKDGWQFNWRQFYKEGGMFYKIIIEKSSDQIEGIAMFSVIDNSRLYVNNIEVSPHNYGNKGKYDFVAGCLIAYGCKLSFKHGKNNYIGFLTFESKTSLISLYQNKYLATLAVNKIMFIDPENGQILIGRYLKWVKKKI